MANRLLNKPTTGTNRLAGSTQQPQQPEQVRKLQEQGTTGVFSNFTNAFKLGVASVFQKAKDYFTTTAPQQLANFITENTKSLRQVSGYTPEQNAKIETGLAEIKTQSEAKYQKSREKFIKWVNENPQLQGKPEWQEGVMKNPSVLKDPDYWAYTMGSLLPFTVSAMASTGATLAVTKNPVLAASVGLSVMNPIVTQDLYDELRDNGADKEQALRLSAMGAPIISAVEVFSDIPVLKIMGVNKLFTRQIAKEATKEFAKKSIALTIGKNIAKIQLIEASEEVAQQSIQNAIVKTVNQNRSIFEDLSDTAIQTLIGSLPLAVVGGASGARMTPQIQKQVETGVAPTQPTTQPIQPESPLAQEARKYKSAEEFAGAMANKEVQVGRVGWQDKFNEVFDKYYNQYEQLFGKAKGIKENEILVHFTGEDIMGGLQGKTGFNKVLATVPYSGGDISTIKNIYGGKNAKTFVATNLKDLNIYNMDLEGQTQLWRSIENNPKILDNLKKQGYDGIRIQDIAHSIGGETQQHPTVMLFDSGIKKAKFNQTKSQLTDIYNQAVKTAPEAKLGGAVKPLAQSGTIQPPSQIALDIEKRLVDSKVAEKGELNLAQFERQTIKEDARIIAEEISQGTENISSILRGEKISQASPRAFLDEVERLITKDPEKNADLVSDLVSSPLITETSEAAQKLGLSQNIRKDTVVSAIQEIKKEREGMAKKRVGDINKKKSEIKKSITKTELKIEEAEKALNKIIC